jgi:hypothetical protein
VCKSVACGLRGLDALAQRELTQVPLALPFRLAVVGPGEGAEAGRWRAKARLVDLRREVPELAGIASGGAASRTGSADRACEHA